MVRWDVQEDRFLSIAMDKRVGEQFTLGETIYLHILLWDS